MTFAILKIIRKGEKPPVWRRMRVPIEITFAQLAVILEKVLEIKETDKYQFDFFRKYRMMEITDETVYENTYSYTYLNSPDTFICNYLEEKKKFTFRIIDDSKNIPEYAVDIEKFAVYESEDKNHVFTPQILKWTVVPDDRYWVHDSKNINKEMEERFGLSYGKNVYPSFHQIIESVRSGNGITISKDTTDITDKKKASTSELLYETGKLLDKIVKSKQQKQYSGFSMSEILSGYSDNHLKLYSQDFKFDFDFSDRDGSLEKFSELLLKPEIIKLNLAILKPESIDLIEKCINDPDIFDSENSEMCKLIDLGYFWASTDNRIFPSIEFSEIYPNYISESYRDYHRKVYWIRNCLFAFHWCYSAVPLEIMYGMYCTNNSFVHDKDEFTELLTDMSRLMPLGITIQNGYIIANILLDDKTYEKIIQKHRNLEWHVIDEKEIRELFEHHYPYNNDAYKMLRTFLKKETNLDDEKIEDTCIKIYQFASTGFNSMEIIIGHLTEMGVLKNNKKSLNLFTPVLKKIIQNTRMIGLKGHTLTEAMTEIGKLRYNELEKKLLSTVDTLYGTKPVYETDPVSHMLNAPFLMPSGKSVSNVKPSPNSPCPCGSGKKYKKCCGLK